MSNLTIITAFDNLKLTADAVASGGRMALIAVAVSGGRACLLLGFYWRVTHKL
jgi:hypothetical protein